VKIIRAPKEKIWIRWGKTGFHPKEERRRKRLKNKSGKKKKYVSFYANKSEIKNAYFLTCL